MAPVRAIVLLAVGLAAGCGGHSAVAPSSQSPTSAAVVVNGTVVSEPSKQPIPGAVITLGGSEVVVADSNGRFRIEASGAFALSADISAQGHLTRRTRIAADANRADLAISLIADSEPFSLLKYRQFARNGFESTTLFELKPWTVNPAFFIKSTDDDGRAVPVEAIGTVREAIMSAVPALSGGRLSVASLAVVSVLPDAADGRVLVSFTQNLSNPGGGAEASVGGNSSYIHIRYPIGWTCGALCWQVGLSTGHEMVHVMGFWHTPGNTEFEWRRNGKEWPDSTLLYSGIVYSRPRGNLDPDTDPTSFRISNTNRRPWIVID